MLNNNLGEKSLKTKDSDFTLEAPPLAFAFASLVAQLLYLPRKKTDKRQKVLIKVKTQRVLHT